MSASEMTVVEWHAAATGNRVVGVLRKNGFDAVYFAGREEAVEHILGFIQPGARVGLGGSMSVQELRLPELAEARGAKLVGMPPAGAGPVSPEEAFELARERVHCDVYLCSSNAVTLDGFLVNVDGVGTRVAAMTFGPKKVVIVVGVNKICPDLDSAYRRIETIAAPMNSRRLNRPNPCAETGICSDCRSDARICRIYSVIKKKGRMTDISVVVVGEPLGY